MTVFRFISFTLILLSIASSILGEQSKEEPAPLDIVIHGSDIDMPAYLFLPPGKGPFPAIISLAGGRGPKMIGKVHPSSRETAALMASRGIAILLLDYSSPDRALLDPRRIIDIGAAVDYLKKHEAIQKQSIFLVGFSMGGTNALRVAGTRDDIAGIVCYFTPNDWRIRKSRRPLKIDKQPVEYCADINCPALILHGDKDIVTEVEQGWHLYKTLKSLNKNVQIIIYKGAGHGFTYVGMRSKRLAYDPEVSAKSFDEVEKFIKTHLKEPSKSMKQTDVE